MTSKRPEVLPDRGMRFFSPQKRPERLWGPPSLLLSVYGDFFHRGYSVRGVKLTTDLYLVPRLKFGGVITLFLVHEFTMWRENSVLSLSI